VKTTSMKMLKTIYDKTSLENKRVILSMLQLHPDAVILDCGCNTGDFAVEIAARIGTTRVFGVEFVKEAADIAESKGIEVYLANLNQRLPVENECFDFVLANQVIEHLSETDVFIKEIYRVLKPGGYAIISTNNLAALHNILSLLLGKQPFPAHVSNEVVTGLLLKSMCVEHKSRGSVHMRIFTYSSLKELFEYHKFKVGKIVSVGYYPLVGKLANLMSRLDPRHATYLTMKVRRI